MTPIHRDLQPTPYGTALDHLSDEIAWVTARCHHLGAGIEATNEAADQAGLAEAATDTDRVSRPTQQKIARLAAAEGNLRRQIDARIEATEAAARVLPLRRLREQLKLDDLEAHALLLATVPCLGLDLYSTLSSIGQFSFGQEIRPTRFSALDESGSRIISVGCGVSAALLGSTSACDRVIRGHEPRS